MTAYIISDVTVRDAAAFEVYRTRAADSIAKLGGRYLVRGGTINILEGNWSPATLILAEFPDVEVAKRWYASPEYAEALKIRDEALSRCLILVDGIDSALQKE